MTIKASKRWSSKTLGNGLQKIYPIGSAKLELQFQGIEKVKLSLSCPEADAFAYYLDEEDAERKL